MARIRSIRPELLTSPELGPRDAETKVFFIGLMSEADDDGRFQADWALLKGSIFPHHDVSKKRVEELLKELTSIKMSGRPLIQLYSLHGVRYGWIPNWRNSLSPVYQVLNRPSESRLPPPPSEDRYPPVPPPRKGGRDRSSDNPAKSETPTPPPPYIPFGDSSGSVPMALRESSLTADRGSGSGSGRDLEEKEGSNVRSVPARETTPPSFAYGEDEEHGASSAGLRYPRAAPAAKAFHAGVATVLGAERAARVAPAELTPETLGKIENTIAVDRNLRSPPHFWRELGTFMASDSKWLKSPKANEGPWLSRLLEFPQDFGPLAERFVAWFGDERAKQAKQAAAAAEAARPKSLREQFEENRHALLATQEAKRATPKRLWNDQSQAYLDELERRDSELERALVSEAA